MTNHDNPAPKGHHTITPFLIVDGASKLTDFLVQAFEAKEISRNQEKDGLILHAEVQIGDSMIMLSDSTSELKSMRCMLYFYVNNADIVYKRALISGATSFREPRDGKYGDRCAAVVDPFGNLWWITSPMEKIPEKPFKKESENDMDESQTFSI